jgi:hypothetical protein
MLVAADTADARGCTLHLALHNLALVNRKP